MVIYTITDYYYEELKQINKDYLFSQRGWLIALQWTTTKDYYENTNNRLWHTTS